MGSLSIAILAHNEANNIEQALDSVSWADQVVVVDAGSTDNTAEIAKKYGAEVFQEENQKNLNINKNIAINQCKSDWIFILDADEEIPYDLAGEIRRIVNSDNPSSGYLVPRRNYVIGKWVKRGSQYPDYQLRLFQRGRGVFPAKHLHERLEIDGEISKLTLPFDHHPYPDFQMLVDKNLRYSEFEAIYHFNLGKRINGFGVLTQGLFRIPLRFFRRYILKGGFLDGIPGFLMSWFDISNFMLRTFRLWELSMQESSQKGANKNR